MSIRVVNADLRVLHMRTRMPFRYGIATLTELPHLFVRLDVEIDGVVSRGIASDGLAPKWFTKNPATSTDHDIAEMIALAFLHHASAQEIPGVTAAMKNAIAKQEIAGAVTVVAGPKEVYHLGASARPMPRRISPSPPRRCSGLPP